jgi:hypothetical protein
MKEVRLHITDEFHNKIKDYAADKSISITKAAFTIIKQDHTYDPDLDDEPETKKIGKIPDQLFIKTVENSVSIRQAMEKLNLIPAGGNYKTFKNRMKSLNIDVSHFTGQLTNKGKTFGSKRDIQVYFDNKVAISSHNLRLRLIRDGIKENKCEHCNLTEFNNHPIPLELDHIDGNHDNNNLTNLRILCPNCHALTPTYTGKNKKLKNKAKIERDRKAAEEKKLKLEEAEKQKEELLKEQETKKKEIEEIKINNPYYTGKEHKRKCVRPLKEELQKLLWEKPTVQIAKQFGVSDKAVEKWSKRYGLTKPERGYWRIQETKNNK